MNLPGESRPLIYAGQEADPGLTLRESEIRRESRERKSVEMKECGRESESTATQCERERESALRMEGVTRQKRVKREKWSRNKRV